MSGVCQRMTGPLYKHGTTLVFINQIREQVGKWSPTGVAETTPGGRALKYYSTIRMSVRRGESLKGEDGELAGHTMKYRIVKNKIFTPFKEAAVNLVYGVGIDKVDEVFQMALKAGYIQQGGAWFTYLDEETGEIREIDGVQIRSQGRAKMIEMIHEIPMLYGELEDKIRGVNEIDMDDMSEEEIEAHKAANKDQE